MSGNLIIFHNSFKIFVICKRSAENGIDFLGYIILPHHKLLRAKTKRRICTGLIKNIQEYKNCKINKSSVERSLYSYLGVLSHADTHKLREKLINLFWFLL